MGVGRFGPTMSRVSWVLRMALVIGAGALLLTAITVAVAPRMHSITFSVVLLVVLMLVTPRGTALRRTLLALPIGTLLHLVFTGAWTNSQVFWWPFLGWSFEDAAHPIAERGWWNVPLELIGLGLCAWVFVRARLADPERRRVFWHTGALALPLH